MITTMMSCGTCGKTMENAGNLEPVGGTCGPAPGAHVMACPDGHQHVIVSELVISTPTAVVATSPSMPAATFTAGG